MSFDNHLQPIYMDEKLPYMSAYADITPCAAKAARELLKNEYKRASDVKNEECYIVDKKPVVAVSIKGTTLHYYVFIQNEMRLFENGNFQKFECILTTTNDKIATKIIEVCGENHPTPRLTEFLVSLKISRPIP